MPDCGSCPTSSSCGNGTCDYTEDHISCPSDCAYSSSGQYLQWVTHAIREDCDVPGSWTWRTKPGDLDYKMYHSQFQMMGDVYGGLMRCYRKPDPLANQDACSPGYDPNTDPLNTPPATTCTKYRAWNDWVCDSESWDGGGYCLEYQGYFKCIFLMANRPLVKCPGCDGWLLSTSARDPWIKGPVSQAVTHHTDINTVGNPTIAVSGDQYGFKIEDAFGVAGAFIPDVDRDGQMDFAIGAPNADGGRGHVVFVSSGTGAELYRMEGPHQGSHFGSSLLWHDDCLWVGTPGFEAETGAVLRFLYGFVPAGIVVGASQGSEFGHSMVAGPWYPQSSATVLVGAPMEFQGRGSVYVVDAHTYDTVVSVRSEDVGSLFELSISSGTETMLVGAPRMSAGGVEEAGAVHFMLADGFPLWAVTGHEDHQNLGWDIDGHQDLNGDGVLDFVVGGPGNGTVTFLNQNSVEWNILRTPKGRANGFGLTVLIVGDVDGDGRPDVAAGTARPAQFTVVRTNEWYPRSGVVQGPNASVTSAAKSTTLYSGNGTSVTCLQGLGACTALRHKQLAVAAPKGNVLKLGAYYPGALSVP